MSVYDIVIKNGWVIDPTNKRNGDFDIGIRDGKVVAVEPELPAGAAGEFYDAAGKWVMPGLVDTHVHLTPYEERKVGMRMLARAGVTCALDCSGPVEDVIRGLRDNGAGINVAVLNRLDPGNTISGPDPSRKELKQYLEKSLAAGALGFKLLGGHLPLTPETITDAIDLCNQERVYVAFHCGSTVNGSNLKGLLEAFEFAGKNRMQVCHINAYCRGYTEGDPVKESMIALKELSARPQFVSESHLATYNCCWTRMENGMPRSHVTRTCLEIRGFEVSPQGALDAARAGYMMVHKVDRNDVTFLGPKEGAAYLEKIDFETMVSFPVNKRSTAFLMATQKKEDKQFVVTALSTDGGGIPRNFLLSHGLSLVRFDALSIDEFVLKSAANPARMLGLNDKGHLGEGADADLIVVDPEKQEALLTIASGRIIMIHGIITGSGGTLLTSEQYKGPVKDFKVRIQPVNLEKSLFYHD